MGAVVHIVTGRVHESCRGEGTQLIKHKSITEYLLRISAAKFFPARRAKFSAGRDVRHPLVGAASCFEIPRAHSLSIRIRQSSSGTEGSYARLSLTLPAGPLVLIGFGRNCQDDKRKQQ